jgi:hypothetical protein
MERPKAKLVVWDGVSHSKYRKSFSNNSNKRWEEGKLMGGMDGLRTPLVK